MKTPVFWTTKDGRKMNVDDMDDNHVRNSFKLLLRNIATLQKQRDAEKLSKFMEPRGEMAIEMIENGMIDEMHEPFDDMEPWDWRQEQGI
jgi:hypothetical protein